MQFDYFDVLKFRLINHLQHLVRERDPYLNQGNHFYVKEYIRQEFQSLGMIEIHSFEVRGKQHENIILNLHSSSETVQKPVILVGAHYDTVPRSSGADDNASGVAVLLEIARFFSQKEINFPLRFVAFDMEEYGLLGSQAYAQYLKQNRQAIRLMISLEMLGYCTSSANSQIYPAGLKYFYPSTGDFIALISNLRTFNESRKMSQVMRQNVPCQGLSVPFNGWLVWDTRRSDHSPFWDAGYKAIMVTDTANLRNPHYHRSTDTLETLDLDFLTRVCLGLIQAIKEM